MRQIVIDTETTGLSTGHLVEDKHRLIEICCLEMIDRKLTDREFHTYLNPERVVDAGAFKIHGLTNEFLNDKPKFSEIVDAFLDFVQGTEVIIHNAPFDVSFIDYELSLTHQSSTTFSDYCTVIDTLPIARRLHVGERNNLDALCKRYKIDNTKRQLHGARLDARLLSEVYLALTLGQGTLFEEDATFHHSERNLSYEERGIIDKRRLNVVKADDDEVGLHANYMELLKKQANRIEDDS